MNKYLLCAILSVASCLPLMAQQTDSTSNSLPDVVVTGSKDAVDVRQLPFTVDIITNNKLTAKHCSSILQNISEQVSGLFVTSRAMMGYGVSGGAAGAISMRGLSGSNGRMMVLIDGHPQYSGIYGHPIADAYQTMMAERIEVLRGPASMLYGSNAMGGVINIVTRGMREDGMLTQFELSGGSFGTIRAEVGNMMRRRKFTSNIAVQYGRSDNHRPNMFFEQYGGHARLGYDFSEHWDGFANFDMTHFNAAYPGSITAPMLDAFQWITRGNLSLGVRNKYEKTQGGISFYSNFGRHKINDGFLQDALTHQSRYFRSNDALTGVSIYQSATLFEGNRITVGADIQNIFGKAYYTSIDTGEVLETSGKQSGESKMSEIAGYVDIRQQLLSWLLIDAGIRLDHHSVVGSEWIPQFGVVLQAIEDGELKAMLGKGFRNPTMREMYLYPSSTEDLNPERIMNYEISWKHRPSNRFNYGVNIYLLKGDNLIQTINRLNVNTGAVENKGIEFDAEWKVNNNLSLTTSHSYLNMIYPIIAAPKYSGYLGSAYSYGQWKVQICLRQVAGLYTAVGNDLQTNDFTLLAASIDYLLGKNVNLWLRGDNLLGSRYEINLGYPMPGATMMCGVNIKLSND